MQNIRLKISPPWITYINKLEALFDGDPLIAFNINYNGENGPEVTLSTTDGDKAAALVKILPEVKSFGNVNLYINVDCPTMSNRAFTSKKELFEVVSLEILHLLMQFAPLKMVLIGYLLPTSYLRIVLFSSLMII